MDDDTLRRQASDDAAAVAGYLERWRPNQGWAEPYVRPAYLECAARPRAAGSIPAWTQLAVMLGDSGATPLCLVVVLFARSLLDDPMADRGLAAHLDLCLWDLGLAESKDERVLLRELGEPATMTRDARKLGQWLLRELAPFGGELERAAIFALRLAALRTGVISGPDQPSIGELLDDELWALT